MAGMEFRSVDQLRYLVKREFSEYIPISSLAEASMFNILHFCSPRSVDQSTKQNWLKKTISTTISSLSSASVNEADSDTGNSDKLVSLGCLFDFCPDNNEEVKTRDELICIHGQASSSQLSGGMEVDMLQVAGSASFENKNTRSLGKIVKSSIPYKKVIYYLKRITAENSPELFREAQKRHLYIIYEVLKAEQLKMAAEEKYDVGGMVESGGIKGNGCWKRNKDYQLSRSKSLGSFVFAYKCGRVRLRKRKTHLELVGLKEFYEGFPGRRPQVETPSQSQTSSQEEEISNDYDNIHVKAEDTNNNTM